MKSRHRTFQELDDAEMIKASWMESDSSSHMLLLLPRELGPKSLPGLQTFTKGLLELVADEEENHDFLEEFERAQTERQEKVVAGELTEAEANLQAADGTWRIAFEESQAVASDPAIELLLVKKLRESIKIEEILIGE